MATTQKLALVTGASSGIGAAFVRALAKRGCDVALCARRVEHMNAVAHDARKQFQIKTAVIEADLSDPAAPETIVAQIREAGRPIDILVNNAGYGLPGYYADTSWADQTSFLQLMLASYAHLAHLTLPGMIERGYGRVVNVASVAGLVPGAAGHTLYAPAKSFLASFSQALSAETRNTGVKVSACCPGFTYSEFHDVNRTRGLVSKLPKFMWMAADDVAEGGLKAVERDVTVYVPGAWNKFVATLGRMLPPSVAEEVVLRQSKHFRSRHGPA